MGAVGLKDHGGNWAMNVLGVVGVKRVLCESGVYGCKGAVGERSNCWCNWGSWFNGGRRLRGPWV